MVSTEEVQSMMQQGMTQQQIIENLKQRGSNDQEISMAISQAQIKGAVNSQSADSFPDQGGAPEAGDNFAGMEPSISQQSAPATQQVEQNFDQYNTQQNYSGYYDPNQAQMAGGGYDSYQPYQGAMSPDIISEIAEQVTSEKMSQVRDRLEKVIDFRTTAETKIESLTKRIERIESILDRLQLSLLQKMGEYINDVHDIKTEMQETQKSFKKLAGENKTQKPTSS